MALPGSDPFEVSAPSITGWTGTDQTVDGVVYGFSVDGDNFCIFAEIWFEDWTHGEYPDQIYSYEYKSAGTLLSMDGPTYVLHLLWLSPDYAPATTDEFTLHIKNPIWYKEQCPADIILAIAHWHCGIPEASIDVTSFTATAAWEGANNLERSVAFVGETVLNIIKKLCEQSYGGFIYINGQNQLASGYVSHPPSTTPDWTIDGDNYIRITRFGIMRGRKIPGRVKIGYNCRHVPPGQPDFGIRTHVNPAVDYTDKELVLDSDYDAEYCDDVAGENIGSYEDMSQYIYCEVEVKGIGHLMDIDEVVKFDEALLGMSIDPSWVDNFRVHMIDLNLEDMTAIIGMVRKITWNIV